MGVEASRWCICTLTFNLLFSFRRERLFWMIRIDLFGVRETVSRPSQFNTLAREPVQKRMMRICEAYTSLIAVIYSS